MGNEVCAFTVKRPCAAGPEILGFRFIPLHYMLGSLSLPYNFLLPKHPRQLLTWRVPSTLQKDILWPHLEGEKAPQPLTFWDHRHLLHTEAGLRLNQPGTPGWAHLPGVVAEHLQGPCVQQQAAPGEQAVGWQLQGGRTT